MNSLKPFDPTYPKICVVGLGYVGLPLAVEFSKCYETIGYDYNEDRIKELKKDYDCTLEISEKELKNSNVKFYNTLEESRNSNIFIITVPTPVDKYNNPDMRALESASAAIGRIMKKNDIIIYESTVYPGATEDYCVPILERESNLNFNIDFYCGYSPERINPGDKNHSLRKIKKIISGSNYEITEFINDLYKSIIDAGTYKASSIMVAEAAKVIENIQRDVNIALINELSIIFSKLNLDTNEVLDAANTKWNFHAYRPGLVGGHCIGVDPYYLMHRAIEVGCSPEMILAGRKINNAMGKFIADTCITEITKNGVNPIGAKIGVLGITFKEDCPDLRNTKVPDIINYLREYRCEVLITDSFADPLVSKEVYNLELCNKQDIYNCDAVIIAVSHDEYKQMDKKACLKMLTKNGIIIDVKSIFPINFFNDTNIKHWRL